MRSGFRCLCVALCRVLVGALLFAQVISAAHACAGAAHSPTMAFAQADHEGDCTETDNANACLQECTADDQSTAQVQAGVAARPMLAVLILPRKAPATVSPLVAAEVIHRSTDPPLSIRFCSLTL